jgi:hypothetical protein
VAEVKSNISLSEALWEEEEDAIMLPGCRALDIKNLFPLFYALLYPLSR